MFRNQYDTDVTVWSPEGRLLQVSHKRMRPFQHDTVVLSLSLSRGALLVLDNAKMLLLSHISG